MSEVSNSPSWMSSFSVLDWIGTLVTVIAIAFLFRFSATVFDWLDMFADFGDVELPVITRLVMRPWVPAILGVISTVILLFAFRKRASLGQRRAWVVASFVATVTFIGLCFYAAYLPIFELAGAVSTE